MGTFPLTRMIYFLQRLLNVVLYLEILKGQSCVKYSVQVNMTLDEKILVSLIVLNCASGDNHLAGLEISPQYFKL